MFNFFKKKQETVVRYAEAYYYKGGVLYKAEMHEFIDADDLNLTRDEYFRKYGVDVTEYDIEINDFRDWCPMFYESLDNFLTDDMVEVDVDDLAVYIQKVEDAFRKQFEDFPLDGTLYTSTYVDEEACFGAIVRPTMKMVNEDADDLVHACILQVDALDGESADTQRKFMTFYDFLRSYEVGCNLKIVDSIYDDDCDDVDIEDYFL